MERRSLIPVDVFLHLSQQWILSHSQTAYPPNIEAGKEFSLQCPLFAFCVSFSRIRLMLQSVGHKNSSFQWRTLSISVVSTTTLTLQRSQLMPPPHTHAHTYPPLSVLEKRIPDLLILLFLLSWCRENGYDTDLLARLLELHVRCLSFYTGVPPR